MLSNLNAVSLATGGLIALIVAFSRLTGVQKDGRKEDRGFQKRSVANNGRSEDGSKNPA